MRRVTLQFVVVIALLFISALVYAQGKITKDPNSIPRSTEKAAETDPRLNQKITYDSGYARLHDVASDLTKMSGVNILSGKNKDDWRVKDAPLVVCVKDMPLGKLLKAIADTTHTYLGSEKVGKDDSKKSYRIYRRSVDEAKIDSYFDNRHKTRLAQVKWQWDAMVAYGKSKEIPGLSKTLWPLAKVIASLDGNSWSKLENGNTLRIGERSAQAKSAFDDLYRLAWDEDAGWIGKEKRYIPDQSADDSIQSAIIKIKLMDKGEPGKTEIQVLLSPIAYRMRYEDQGAETEYTTQCLWQNSPGDTLSLQGKLQGLPPYPEPVKLPTYEDDMANPDMAYLKPQEDTEWPSRLKEKIAFEKPKDAKKLMFADFVRMLASASGLNIVTEDFLDQLKPNRRVMDAWFMKETTVADTIIRMSRNGIFGNQWFCSQSENLLIGWADDRATSNGWDDKTSYCSTWRHHHRNLVSENYLNSLREKLAGDGVEFDDAVTLSALSEGSFSEWIRDTADLFPLSAASHLTNDGWWPLYGALSESDKQLAKSANGAPLGKYDPNWIADFFRKQRLREENIATEWIRTEEDENKERANIDAASRAVSDPSIISTMVMYLTQKPELNRYVSEYDSEGNMKGSGPESAPKELKLYRCQLNVCYKVDGAPQSVTIDHIGNLSFPIRSREREAEIIKAAKEKEAAK